MTKTANEYAPLDRRPIASRNAAPARAIARLLVRCRLSPNAISILGALFAIAAGCALWATSRGDDPTRWLWIAAAFFVQLRLAANMFDGMVALETGCASPVGELYNDVPDRVSDAAVLIGLGYARGGSVELGYLAACAAIMTAYVRATGKAAGARQEFCGPMAKPHRMFLVTLIALYSGLAPAQWQPSLDCPVIGGIPAIGLAVIILGSLVTVVRRLSRIATQLRGH